MSTNCIPIHPILIIHRYDKIIIYNSSLLGKYVIVSQHAEIFPFSDIFSNDILC